MKPIENFYENKTGESASYRKLGPGLYEAVILGVTNHEEEGFLEVKWDIASGEFKGYYSKQAQRFAWTPNTQRVYYGRSVNILRKFIEAIVRSNPDYVWDWQEDGLVGKVVGIVLNSQERHDKDGKVKNYMRIESWVSTIELDDMEMPEPRKLKSTTTETPESAEDFPPFGRGVPLNLEEDDSEELPY